MMELSCQSDRCSRCIGSEYVCHCLKVTEDSLIDTIVTLGIRNLRELRQQTGAGDGCMSCRIRLQKYVDEYARCEQVESVAMELTMVG